MVASRLWQRTRQVTRWPNSASPGWLNTGLGWVMSLPNERRSSGESTFRRGIKAGRRPTRLTTAAIEAHPMPRQLRAALWLAYAVYLGWVVYLVWTPSPGLPGTTITRVVNLAARLGVTVDSSQVEFALNIVMLVPAQPASAACSSDACGSPTGRRSASARASRSRWSSGSLLPTRSGSSRDIVANTLGAFLGAALLVLALGILAQHRHPRGGATTPARPLTR